MDNAGTYFFLVVAACALCLSLWVLVKTIMLTGRSSVGVTTNSDSLLV